MVYPVGTGATLSSAPIDSGATPSFTFSSHNIGSRALSTSSWSLPPTYSNTWNPPSSSNHGPSSSHHTHPSIFIETTTPCRNSDAPPISCHGPQTTSRLTPEQKKEARRNGRRASAVFCLLIVIIIGSALLIYFCTR